MLTKDDNHRRTGDFFLGDWAIFARKNFRQRPKICKITLPGSPYPIIISKNPGFLALYLARWNEFRFLFNKYKNIYVFPFLAAGLICSKNLDFARKIMVVARVRGPAAPSPSGSYAYDDNVCLQSPPWLIKTFTYIGLGLNCRQFAERAAIAITTRLTYGGGWWRQCKWRTWKCRAWNCRTKW